MDDVVERPATVEYAAGAVEDPWAGVVRFVAVLGVIEGCRYVLEAVGHLGWISHQGSNLAVHLFYLGWEVSIQTIGRLGAGACGAVLAYAGARCFVVRTGGRRMFVAAAIGAVAFAGLASLPAATWMVGRSWEGVRFRGVVNVTTTLAVSSLILAREVLIPGMMVYVMTRPGVRARFAKA